jgi:hypothetical protein
LLLGALLLASLVLLGAVAYWYDCPAGPAARPQPRLVASPVPLAVAPAGVNSLCVQNTFMCVWALCNFILVLALVVAVLMYRAKTK